MLSKQDKLTTRFCEEILACSKDWSIQFDYHGKSQIKWWHNKSLICFPALLFTVWKIIFGDTTYLDHKSILHVSVARGNVDVHDPCFHCKPCWCPQSMLGPCWCLWFQLLLTIMDKKNTCCSGIDDSRLTSDNEKHRRLLNLAQTKIKSLSRQEALEESS